MPRLIASVLVSILWGWCTVAAAQLPPEILMDRYMVQAERLMKENDSGAALEAMEKVVALQKEYARTLPDEFDFKYGQVLLSAGEVRAAIDAVSRYLAAKGRSGGFYRQALELLDQAERKQDEREKAQATADESLAKAERLIAEKNYKAAADLAIQLLDLRKEHDLTFPNEFHFVVARAALSLDRIKDARDSAAEYLSVAGPSGKYFGETQELLEEARAKMRSLLKMVVIPEGSFRMGCVSGEDCQQSEFAVHVVRFASFELSKYEVTFEEYDRFVAATGRRSPDDEGWGRGRRPVINVSWEDAVAYTEWLSSQTGERYRLPTEAEWEYAARAGAITPFHFGDEMWHLCRYANYADGSIRLYVESSVCLDGIGARTATVGTYEPNAFGLHDMHGNVWEWVQDCWNDSYLDAPTDGSAWTSGDCERRVLRGGSWFDLAQFHRAAYRHKMTTGGRDYVIGFRVARTLAP